MEMFSSSISLFYYFFFSLGDLFRHVKKTNPRLCEVGLIFVETITKLLSRLLDYRSVISSEDNLNNRMSCNVNILVWISQFPLFHTIVICLACWNVISNSSVPITCGRIRKN